MPIAAIALACAGLLALGAPAARASPPTPAELAASPAGVDAIDDAYDAGFWHGTGGPLIVAGIAVAIPGLTGALTGAVEGRSDVVGVAAALLAVAGAHIGVGGWLVLNPPERGPAAARSAGFTAGRGAILTVYGALMAAGLVMIFTSDAPLSDYGGEFLAVPSTLLMLGFGASGYVSGKQAHWALVDAARPPPVSGVRHLRPDASRRLPVVTLLRGRF